MYKNLNAKKENAWNRQAEGKKPLPLFSIKNHEVFQVFTVVKNDQFKQQKQETKECFNWFNEQKTNEFC